MSTMSAERESAAHLISLLDSTSAEQVKAAVITILCNKHDLEHTEEYSEHDWHSIMLIHDALEEALDISMPIETETLAELSGEPHPSIKQVCDLCDKPYMSDSVHVCLAGGRPN